MTNARSTQHIVAFVIICFLCLSANAAFGQTKAHNLTKYGLSFSIPVSHTTKQDSPDTFESGDNLTWIEVYPYKTYSATAKGMIQDVANQRSFKIESEGAYTSGGYDGYWIRCKTDKHPSWKFWIIGFIDPNSDTNFYSVIWWKDGNQIAYNIAYKMSYSFKKMQ
jgi:hypothetical protein